MLHCVVHVQINTSVHTAEYEHVTCLIARSADIKELPQPAILVSFLPVYVFQYEVAVGLEVEQVIH